MQEAQSGDWVKNMFRIAWDDITTGDGTKLDHSIKITGKDGSYTISGTINDSKFEINVTVKGNKITFNSNQENVDESKGGVIKATGGDDEKKS